MFKQKTEKELAKLTNEELNAYIIEKNEFEISDIKAKMETADAENKLELEAQIKALQIENLVPLTKAMEAMSNEIKNIKNAGIDVNSPKAKKSIRKAWDSAIEKMNFLLTKENFTRGTNFSFEIEKDVTYGDITGGDYLTPTRTSVTDLPKRVPIFSSLFNSITITSDIYAYLEQATVVRDAQNVANCAQPISKETKETLVRATIEPKKIVDIIPFCNDYISDYSFMAGRIRTLLNDSMVLKIDQQIMFGTGAGLETNSINQKSSEFSAVNVIFPVATKIQDPTVADLVGAMATQIDIIGKEASYSADVVIMNKGDFFLLTATKDANGRSLESEVVTYLNGVAYIKGMRVVTSPLIDENTLYVIDSSKGDIVDRKGVTVSISTENNDLWEKDHSEIKAVVRLNLLIENNNANAFMKCSDVATSIVAITKP